MHGFREIDGFCIDCMTWDEAVEVALLYTNASGKKNRIEGEHLQHIRSYNVTKYHIYCYRVIPLGEPVGNQGIEGTARSNGRAD